MTSPTNRLFLLLSTRRSLSTTSSFFGRNRLNNAHKTLTLASRRLDQNLLLEERRMAREQQRNQHKELNPLEQIKQSRDRIRRYCAAVRAGIGTAIAQTDFLRAAFVGRGLQFTKVHPTYNFDSLVVFWASSKRDIEAETVEMMEAHKEDLRLAISNVCPELGRVPKLEFEKDLDYISVVPLETEFSRLREEKQRQVFSEDEAVVELERLMDEICAMKPKTDVLGFDRAAAVKQVLDAVQRGKASHRLTLNPSPEASLEFQDYMRSNYESRSKDRSRDIKRYVAQKKREVLNKNRVLESERQPK